MGLTSPMGLLFRVYFLLALQGLQCITGAEEGRGLKVIWCLYYFFMIFSERKLSRLIDGIDLFL